MGAPSSRYSGLLVAQRRYPRNSAGQTLSVIFFVHRRRFVAAASFPLVAAHAFEVHGRETFSWSVENRSSISATLTLAGWSAWLGGSCVRTTITPVNWPFSHVNQPHFTPCSVAYLRPLWPPPKVRVARFFFVRDAFSPTTDRSIEL